MASVGMCARMLNSTNMPPSSTATFETILVVDDDAMVLRIVVKILEIANFLVLSAESGPAALRLAESTDATIHLLLSDIDMSEMSGADLGKKLKEVRPNVQVMLMSGGVNRSHLALTHDWAFIQKPFVPGELVELVTEVLHSPARV